MKSDAIRVGGTYLAYVGSLSPVLVVGKDTNGRIRVRAVNDVQLAAQPGVRVHRAGDEFVMQSRNVVRVAE